MIPGLFEQLRNTGISPLLVGFVLVAVLTASLFLAYSVAQWFGDRDS